MHAQRWMLFIPIQQPQSFEELLPLRSAEVLTCEGGKERVREVKSAVGVGHLFAQGPQLRFRKLLDALLARVAVSAL